MRDSTVVTFVFMNRYMYIFDFRPKVNTQAAEDTPTSVVTAGPLKRYFERDNALL
jgi:hypothetical protein